MVSVSYKMSFNESRLLNASVDCYVEWLNDRVKDKELPRADRSEASAELMQAMDLRKKMRA